ncbi:MAG: hypothetical protein LBS58_03155, partial [Coriobacteriales bacterium]|nr:hypothetical protein [Coriobacteriales bacterium]
MKNKKNASSRHNRVPNLFSRMMTVLLVAVMVIGMFPAGASAAPVTSSAEKVTPAVTPPESAPPEEGVEEEGEPESTEPEEPAVEEGTEGTEGTEGIEGAEGTGGVAAAPTGGGIGILDVGDAYVTTWAEFVTAYRNNTAGVVTRIILMNSITNPASAAANRPGVTARTANLEIISDPTTSNTYTIDFGTDTTATNSLVLGTATTAHSLTLTNVKIAHAGTAAANAVVYSSTSAANAIGWTVTFNNVSQVGTTQPSPLVQQSGSGFNVVLAGTVNWNSTTVSNVITARNLTFAA